MGGNLEAVAPGSGQREGRRIRIDALLLGHERAVAFPEEAEDVAGAILWLLRGSVLPDEPFRLQTVPMRPRDHHEPAKLCHSGGAIEAQTAGRVGSGRAGG